MAEPTSRGIFFGLLGPFSSGRRRYRRSAAFALHRLVSAEWGEARSAAIITRRTNITSLFVPLENLVPVELSQSLSLRFDATMVRIRLHPASGSGQWKEILPKVIRFARFGCTNRPFYHIVIMHRHDDMTREPIEQLGTYDPSENQYKEKLVSFNFERIQWWLGQGNVTVSQPVEELMGLAGFFPIHPRTYMTAWRNRKAADAARAKAQSEAASAEVASAQAS